VFNFSAGDVVLFEPVTLWIPYEAPDDVDPSDIYGIRWDAELEAWEDIGGEPDPSSKALKASVDHLSLFSVFWPSKSTGAEREEPRVTARIVKIWSDIYPDYTFSEQVSGSKFLVHFRIGNKGDDDFQGLGRVELSFPGSPDLPVQSQVKRGWKAPGRLFPQIFTSELTTRRSFEPFAVTVDRPGLLNLQLDLVFETDKGEELSRDSKQASILITDRLRIGTAEVLVDGRKYQVQTRDHGQGRLEYVVEGTDSRGTVSDTLLRSKAVYTAAIQQSIRRVTREGYVLKQRVSQLVPVAARLSVPTSWVLARPGRLGAAAIKGASVGGPHGAVVSLGTEVTGAIALELVKQIGDHPEAYIQQTAIELIDEAAERTKQQVQVQVRVADGGALTYEEAVTLGNHERFISIYAPAAKKAMVQIQAKGLDWRRDSLETGVKALGTSQSLPLGEIIDVAEFVGVMSELDMPLQEYPPYRTLVEQINVNRAEQSAGYERLLATLGMTDHAPFELAVLSSGPEATEAGQSAPTPPEQQHASPEVPGPGQANLLWSFETGGRVYTVAMTPDGSRVAVGSHDNNVYLLDGRGR
jgi:hypothetical protein